MRFSDGCVSLQTIKSQSGEKDLGLVFLVLVGEFSGLVNLTGALTLKTGAAIKFLTLSAYLRDFFLPCAIEKDHTNQTKRYLVLDE